MTYPRVRGESETLQAVLAGQSLARYGDGEFRMCEGGSLRFQTHAPALQARLRAILHDSGDCAVGIPNILSETPKRAHWQGYAQFARLLAPRPYSSAFVSRPDSAPWIDTPAYWAALESLWVGQDVTLVRGSAKSLTAADLIGSGEVTEIVAPSTDAWSNYDALLDRVGTPARALLCLGPTATVMAVDLCARGVQAVDLGHVGLFLRKVRRGEPRVVTAEDRAA